MKALYEDPSNGGLTYSSGNTFDMSNLPATRSLYSLLLKVDCLSHLGCSKGHCSGRERLRRNRD